MKHLKNIKTNHKFSRLQLIIFITAFALIGFLIIKSFAAPNPSLPGDLNNDNTVNVTDMSIILQWLPPWLITIGSRAAPAAT